MIIRNATYFDIEEIEEIYSDARSFMRENGNMSQWTGTYPAKEDIMRDICESCLYVCVDENEILGVFFFKHGDDPTYKKIYNGKWINNDKYAVVHRIAVSKKSHGKGVAAFCLNYAFDNSGNVKIDTHRDNIPMQKALIKNGFTYCGIIHLLNGDDRLAYQKSK